MSYYIQATHISATSSISEVMIVSYSFFQAVSGVLSSAVGASFLNLHHFASCHVQVLYPLDDVAPNPPSCSSL